MRNCHMMFGKLLRAFIACAAVFLFANTAFACTSDEIDVLGDGTQCETTKFSVTTTSDATELKWTMTATGTFYVNCGDGGTLTQNISYYGTISGKTITRTSTDQTIYTCSWPSAGEHTVRFAGTATGYNTGTSAAISFYNTGTQSKVASVDGSLGQMFPVTNGNIPRFVQTFYECTNLSSIPAGLFSSINTSSATNTSYMFYQTFYGCSGLTGAIPANLFGSVNTSSATNTSYMFYLTFYNCTNLTSIPAGLFSGIDTSSATSVSNMFNRTFERCTNLSSVPAGLFSSINTSSAADTSSMFSATFKGCTNLSSIPAGLFSGIDTSSATNTNYMFYNTFYNCTGLTGAIPTGLFSTINTSSATNTSYMFTQTFFGCTNLSGIPADLFSGIDTSSATDTTYMFSNTFSGCTNLSGYIPPTAFPSTITPGSSSSSNMWYRTFYNTKLATSCASYPGTAQYITGFESDWASNGNGGRVSCYASCPIGQYGVSPACTACSNNKPANSSYSAASITATCPWTCDDGYVSDNGSCRACNADEFSVDHTTCETTKFSVTTTNDATTLSWTMTATGTFYVNCGDGGTLTAGSTTISNNTITRTSTSQTTYTCSWPSAGVYTVRFGGTATGYSTGISTPAISFYMSSNGTQAKVASVDGSLGQMFPVTNGNIPRFYTTFNDCTNLTSIPAGLFSGINTSSATDTSWMFGGTFYNCTGLTSLPAGLFSGIDTSSATDTSWMFYSTFNGCTSLTGLPAGLFGGINASSATNTTYMFYTTFYNCTGLTTIPAGLFSDINISSATNTTYMFYQTFYGCTNLTGIPAGLFSGIDTSSATNTGAMFYQTFSGCTNLSGYIPPTAFPSTITPGSSSSNSMWYRTFYNTQLATSCASYPGTAQYITGFESDWASNGNGGRVSCELCAALPEHATYVANSCSWNCDDGYYADNDACIGNIITINWSGASQADIEANDAGSVTYGGDIRTPRAATTVPGKIFRGWKFSKPSGN